MDFDGDRIFYSHQNLHQQKEEDETGGGGVLEDQVNQSTVDAQRAAAAARGIQADDEEFDIDSDALRRHYREFLSE